MKAVLFDIDGTLTRSAGVGHEAMARGLASAAQWPIGRARELVADMDFRGCTDMLIVEDMVVRAGLTPGAFEARILAAYIDALDEGLQAKPTQPLPGVMQLVTALEQAQIHVGLLTGNVRAGARKKLAPFGLAHLVDRIGGFGDDARERPAIAKRAAQLLAALGVLPHAAVVIGDTQHDVTAARAASMRAVTVATGWTDKADLLAVKPDAHLDDLAHPAALWALLDGLG